jgi:hypothetical protein
MKPGQALDNIMVSPDDFGGDAGSLGCTVFPSNETKLIECMKCEKCGWSVTVATEESGV